MDFSDFPMDKSFGIQPGEHVPGEAMHDYFVEYALKWDILRRIKFNTVVATIERDKVNTRWEVCVKNKYDAIDDRILHTRKLIVATGVTNAPHRPHLSGQDYFDGPILHTAELGCNTEWLGDAGIQTVVVIGGGKSAYDAVYLAACAGKQVEWIIRKSGKGPAWVFPAKATLGAFRALREVRYPVLGRRTRLMKCRSWYCAA